MRLEIKKEEIRDYWQVRSGRKYADGTNMTYVIVRTVRGTIFPLDEDYAEFDDAYRNDLIHENNWIVWE